MKIRSLTLKNIGVFGNETIDFPENKEKGLAEIHILTGQNGTGKTTILQALASGMAFTEPFNSDVLYNQNGLSKNKFEYTFFKKLTPNQSKAILKFANINEEITIVKGDTSRGKGSNGIPLYYEINTNKSVEENSILYNEYRQKFGISFSSFAYSGYRFIEHQENINIKEKENYNPLKNALEFVKDYGENDYTLNQWLANNISKRSFARDEGNEEKAKIFDKNIKFLEQIIQEIIEKPIKFEPVYETGIKIVANIEGKKLDFDLLPDGLRSIISWLGDLIMRMDALKWKDDLDIFEREFILFLDEIEVHLHPYWQRKILPVIQKTFVNAQIFITTHSPFIVNSVDGAFIYELKLDEKGNCKVELPIEISSTSKPIDEVLQEIYDISPTQMYGDSIKKEIEDFQADLEKAYQRKPDFNKNDFLKRAKKLASKSTDIRNNVQFELRQLSNNLAESFDL